MLMSQDLSKQSASIFKWTIGVGSGDIGLGMLKFGASEPAPTMIEQLRPHHYYSPASPCIEQADDAMCLHEALSKLGPSLGCIIMRLPLFRVSEMGP